MWQYVFYNNSFKLLNTFRRQNYDGEYLNYKKIKCNNSKTSTIFITSQLQLNSLFKYLGRRAHST